VLRTNLFNAKDSIAPVKSYYYGYDGQINNEKSKKRENNIREANNQGMLDSMRGAIELTHLNF